MEQEKNLKNLTFENGKSIFYKKNFATKLNETFGNVGRNIYIK